MSALALDDQHVMELAALGVLLHDKIWIHFLRHASEAAWFALPAARSAATARRKSSTPLSTSVWKRFSSIISILRRGAESAEFPNGILGTLISTNFR
jgi:hypothetical protein